jgi:hypothetical protein
MASAAGQMILPQQFVQPVAVVQGQHAMAPVAAAVPVPTAPSMVVPVVDVVITKQKR